MQDMSVHRDTGLKIPTAVDQHVGSVGCFVCFFKQKTGFRPAHLASPSVPTLPFLSFIPQNCISARQQISQFHCVV